MKPTIETCLSGCTTFEKNKSLAPFSTYNIGGVSDYFVAPSTTEELSCIVRCVQAYHLPYVVIGGGSNILIADKGFRGIVIHPVMKDITQRGTTVHAGAGIGLQQLLQYARKNGLSGLEHMTGIPGSLGGALAGNAGTATKWINSCVVAINAVNMKDGQPATFKASECNFAYRSTIFKYSDAYCITSGTFTFTIKKPSEITLLMTDYLKKRTKQPTGDKSAGCVFKNPDSIPAGKLIEELGLKGMRMGSIQISKDHGNFMLNTGGGRATDVIKLISYVKQQARDKRGIQLQEEVRYIGF